MSCMGVDVAEAFKICDSVNVNWPSDTEIVWLKLNDGADERADISEEVCALTKKSMALQNVKTKLLDYGQMNYNVCQSVPHTSSFPGMKWPGKNIASIKKLWVSPSDIKTAVREVINEVKDMWRDDCLVLYGCPLTSQLYRNILYVVGQLFNMVGIVQPQPTGTILLFYSFQKWTISYERHLKQICKSMTDDHHLQDLSSNSCKNTLFKYLAILNCAQLKYEVMDIIHNIEAADDQVKLESQRTLVDSDKNNNSIKCHSCEMIGKCSVRCQKLKQELEDFKCYLQQITLSNPEGSTYISAGNKFKEILEIEQKSTKAYNIMEVTQFCLKQLLCCQRKLCDIFKSTLELTEEDISRGSCLKLDPNQNILTSLNDYSWSLVPIEVKVLDFGKELWMNIENHADYQIDTLLRICSALEDTWRGESLELRGFPMLSEFNASLIFILGHLFDEVRFSTSSMGRNSIFFNSFKNYPRSVRDHFERVFSELSDDHAVMSLVPLKFILGGDFYEKVRDANNQVALKQCHYMIKLLCLEMDDAKRI